MSWAGAVALQWMTPRSVSARLAAICQVLLRSFEVVGGGA